jgi:GAF domain-containing protein
MLVRREHALLALVELNRRLGRSLDAHGAAEALLLNLMGQFGTARSALWLSTGSSDGKPVLIRCHGVERPLVEALEVASWGRLLERFRADPRPVTPAAVRGGAGASIEELARRAQVELFAPLGAESEPLGLVALGPRLGGRTYEALDLQVLEASLSIAGVAIHNAQLNARVLESNRRLRAALEELRELDRLKSEFIKTT